MNEQTEILFKFDDALSNVFTFWGESLPTMQCIDSKIYGTNFTVYQNYSTIKRSLIRYELQICWKAKTDTGVFGGFFNR